MASTSDFDRAFYLAQNPDVAAAGIDPLTHFQQYGILEKRAPNQTIFNGATAGGIAAPYSDAYNMNMSNPYGGLLDNFGSNYLAANPDVVGGIRSGTFTSALDHYNKTGKNEGRAWGSGWGENVTTSLNPTTGAATYGGQGYTDQMKIAAGGQPAMGVSTGGPYMAAPPTNSGGLGGLGGAPAAPAFDPTALFQQQSSAYQQMMQQMMQNQTNQMSEWQKSLGANFGKTYNPTGTGGSFSNTQSPVYRPGGQTDTGLAAANGFGGGWDNGPFRKTF